MSADKSLKVRIEGDSRGLTQAADQARREIERVADASKQIASNVTGGVIGGGLVGSVMGMVSIVRSLVAEARALQSNAARAEVGTNIYRGWSNSEDLINAPRGTIAGAAMNARRQRSEAEAGAGDAQRAFERLGISLSEIAGLRPDELFNKINAAFRASAQGRQERFALRQLYGQAGQENLDQFIGGGYDFNQSGLQTWGLGWSVSKAQRTFDGVGPGSYIWRERRNAMEPLAMEGFANEEQAGRLAEANRLKLLEITRSQLGVEERLTQAVADRDALVRRIYGETDSALKQQLIGRALGIEQEIVRLQAEAGKSAGRSGSSLGGGGVSERPDQLQRMGLIVGGPAVPPLAREILREVQRLATVMEQQTQSQQSMWS
jgi:hypothetical protein